LGQNLHSEKGEVVSFHYDVKNAVVMPAGDLASE